MSAQCDATGKQLAGAPRGFVERYLTLRVFLCIVAGIGITLFVNWAVKPFTLAAPGWFFIRYVVASWLPAEQIDSYIAGLILLGAALATVVGVLVEVPVMLWLVRVVNNTQGWYERGLQSRQGRKRHYASVQRTGLSSQR